MFIFLMPIILMVDVLACFVFLQCGLSGMFWQNFPFDYEFSKMGRRWQLNFGVVMEEILYWKNTPVLITCFLKNVFWF